MHILVNVNVDTTVEDDPQVGVIANNYVPRWDVTNLVTGSIYNDPNNGNVGIGTASPGEKLEVSGNILLSDGSSRLIRAYVSDDTSTPALEIKVKKNVLTSPFLPVVDNKLSVFNTLSRDGNSDNIPATRIESAIDTVGSGNRWSSGIRFSTQSDSYSWGLGSYATMFAERMRITGNGKVGIGTKSPASSLQIDRSPLPTTISPANSYLGLGVGSQYGAGTYSIISFGYGVNQAPAYIGYYATTTGNYGKGDLIFGTRADSTIEQAPIERMRIDSGGNVGIGTENPGYKLHINAVDSPGLFIGGTGGGSSYGYFYANQAGGNYFKIQANTGGGGNQFLALQPDGGNVGIGTPSPAYKLDVNGNAVIRDSLFLSGGDRRIQAIIDNNPALVFYSPQSEGDTTALIPAPYGFMVARSDNLGPNMEVHANGRVEANGFDIRSDDRIKFNEQQLEYGLAQIMALEPKRYDRAEWEIDPTTEELIIHPEKTKNEIGMVAQEVQRVIPEAVSVPENENSALWSISYDTLIPVLIKAIQEQQTQIEELKKEIQTMMARNAP